MANPNLKPPLSVQIGPYTGILRIHRGEGGLAWIDDSNIKVIEVILEHIQGQSPGQIHENYPHLSLAQIYAAIAYYYDHMQEIDTLIQAGWEAYKQGWQSAENQEWREKIMKRATQEKKAVSSV